MGAIPNILSVVTFLPLVGAGLIVLAKLMAKSNEADIARWVAMVTTLVVLAVSTVLVLQFDPSNPAYQFVENYVWFAGAGYHLGVDGVSILFVLLTAFLMPICILASWKSVETRVGDYMIAFLVLETLVIGVFTSLDLFLFYIFFEGTLVPMFIIIGVWGGANRIYAAYKFFLYTLLGSVLMLLAMLWMANEAGTTSIPALKEYAFGPWAQSILWLAFFASFAVKMPMWPVHTWLPDAHVQAPTAGSVILAGILLKLGGYGFILFNVPMFPDASVLYRPLVFTLSVIAIAYTSLVAFRQTDIKKLIAYSSVAHMGFVTMGIFAGNAQGMQGAVFQMLSHGLISGALFLCVGVVYDRMHTREIAFYGGLTNRMPWYAAIFLMFTMANVGLPGTSGFVGEILTMTGVYQASTWAAFVAATGVILSAVYALTLYRNVMFGEITNPALATIKDIDLRELVIFVPLIVGTIWLGVQPDLVLNYTAASVDAVVNGWQLATGG
jgi:NADH-quinone oxidoreductase subunit M